jgi:hypothetical protein
MLIAIQRQTSCASDDQISGELDKPNTMQLPRHSETLEL